MYDEKLAGRILETLNAEFPRPLNDHELRTAIPESSQLPDEEWFQALEALRADGLLSGKLIGVERGFAAAMLRITESGRRRIQEHTTQNAQNVPDPQVGPIVVQEGSAASTSPQDQPSPTHLAKRTFKREGDFWTVVFEGKSFHLKATEGARHLSHLLTHPNRDFAATELLQSTSGRRETLVEGSEGDMADGKALAEYKARVVEIRLEIAAAERNNDTGQAEVYRTELDQILDQIRAVTGLGGHRRVLGERAERARKSVSARVTYAIDQIRAHHRGLAEHLALRILKGRSFSYRGDGIEWNS